MMSEMDADRWASIRLFWISRAAVRAAITSWNEHRKGWRLLVVWPFSWQGLDENAAELKGRTRIETYKGAQGGAWSAADGS